MDWAETAAMVERARAEIPVSFPGPSGRLCGIVTAPAPGAASAQRWIVFPGHPRFATRRLRVLSARILAAAGFSCLRFDLHGSGESAGDAVNPERANPYGGDVAAAIRYIRQIDRTALILLTGYCFDGLSALSAFEREPDAIDGLFLAAGPIAAERIDRAAANPRGGVRGVIAGLFSRERQGPAPRLSGGFVAAFDSLVRSRASALLIYGSADYMSGEADLLEESMRELDHDARTRVRLERWPGSLRAVGCEPVIYDRMISWAMKFHARAGYSDDADERVRAVR
jgi:alpha/beta superfamily hydrolase